jgi:hypothetical protein
LVVIRKFVITIAGEEQGAIEIDPIGITRKQASGSD